VSAVPAPEIMLSWTDARAVRVPRVRSRRFPVTYVIADPCVDIMDKSCIEECPVDCIYVGERMLYIQPDECVDCGACEPVCPVEAIYYEDDVPDQWKDYTKANADFFVELGSPGGAAKVGESSFDPPMVKDLPPREKE
jgi:NAD-dependent dihydropyrimidine dehydrogenase PreA subunit